MKELLIYVIHTPAGAVALISAILALVYKKGSPRHLLNGNIFTISMITMLVSGAIITTITKSFDDFYLSIALIYTVFTAWLTAYRKNGETGILEYIALVWVFILGIFAWILDPSWGSELGPKVYYVWVGLAIFMAVGDIYNIYCKGLSRRLRLLRHIWRVCFSLVWAVLGFGDKLTKMSDQGAEAIPLIIAVSTLSVLIVMIYWMVKVITGSKRIVKES